MALIAWWPLNGNTNEVVSGNNGINNNSIVSNGLIGSSMSFNGDHQYIIVNANERLNSIFSGSFSISLWVNLSSYSYNGVIGKYAGIWTDGCFCIRISAKKVEFITATETSSHKQLVGKTNLDLNKWYNIVCTFDSRTKTKKIYLNGVLEASEILSSQVRMNTQNIIIGGYTLNTEYTLFGKLNDIKLYDHALSLKEIKELYKCCVLHYKFDDPEIESTTNLGGSCATYDYQFNMYSWGGDAGTCTHYKNGGYNNYPYKKYHKTHSGTGGIFVDYGIELSPNAFFTLEEGHTYTFSCYVKASAEFTDSTHSFTIVRTDNYYIHYNEAVHFTTEWQRLSRTITITADQAGVYKERSIIYYDGLEDFYVYYSGFQIEEKDHATPFTPTSRIGYKVFDNSGYKHNGYVNGLIPWNSETSAPNGSYIDLLSGNGNDISIGSAGELSFISNGSISFWAKYLSENENLFKMVLSEQNNTTHYVGAVNPTSSKQWYENVGTVYVDGELGTEIVEDGNWHLYTFSGVDLSTWSSIANIARFNSTDNSFQFHGYLSDFKIYATPLTAEQIKNEYSAAVSVHNGGILSARSFKENKDNMIDKVNYDIYQGAFTSVTIKKEQSNCAVSIENNAIRIYRAPGILKTSSSNWGGFGINLMELGNKSTISYISAEDGETYTYVKSDFLLPGRRYRIKFTASGFSNNLSLQCGIDYNWGSPNATPHLSTNIVEEKSGIIPTNFGISEDGTTAVGDVKECFYEFLVPAAEDSLYRAASENYASTFIKGKIYSVFKTFHFNFSYDDSGEFGTDVYLSNFIMEDITNDVNSGTASIKSNGIVETRFNEVNSNKCSISKANAILAAGLTEI